MFALDADTRAWMRRKALFSLAKEQHCNKIALAHHQDDMLVTLLMNMLYQGSVSTMPPKLKMTKFDMEIIRPLCLVAEEELRRIAAWKGFRSQIKLCPYETASRRKDAGMLLAQMEALNPEARYSLWHSMENIQTDYLPKKIK